MLSQVVLQAAQRPTIFEAKMIHFLLRLFWRQMLEIYLVERGDQAGPVAPDIAMEINRTKLFVGQYAQDLPNVLFRGRRRRGIDSGWYDFHPILIRSVFFHAIEQGKEFHI